MTAVEQQVLDLLLKRFEGRAPAYLILQLVRSSDLIKFGRDDPKRIREWADAAAKLIEDVLKWRAEFGIDELLDAKLDKHDEFLSMWPDVVNGTDAYGRPVHWQRLGIIQPEAIMGNFSEREIIRHHSQSTELCRDECMRFAKRNGHVFVGQIEVLDLTGFGMHHFSPRFFRLIKAVISVDLTKYDGMMQGMVRARIRRLPPPRAHARVSGHIATQAHALSACRGWVCRLC